MQLAALPAVPHSLVHCLSFPPCPCWHLSFDYKVQQCGVANDNEQYVGMSGGAVLVLWQDSTGGQSLQRINR